MRRLARVFKAMGDDTRLRILEALLRDTYCVCDLAKEMGLSQPTLSHHLKILRDTELVHGERNGQWTFCSVNHRAFDELGLDLPRLLQRYGKESST